MTIEPGSTTSRHQETYEQCQSGTYIGYLFPFTKGKQGKQSAANFLYSYKSKIAVFLYSEKKMERQPRTAHAARKRRLVSSDEDSPIDESSASLDGEAQSSQILEASSQILAESQNDDGAADDDAVPQASQASTPAADGGSQGDTEHDDDDDAPSEMQEIKRMIDDEEDGHQIFLFRDEEMRARQESRQMDRILFGTATIRFLGNSENA